MIPLPLPIVATLVEPASGRIARGVGTVEKRLDDGTYLIRMASGKIQARVVSGDLEIGSAVAVTRQGDQLAIKPLNSGQPELSRTDDYFRSASKGSIESGGQRAVTLSGQAGERFVRFETGARAAQWLAQQGAALPEADRAVPRNLRSEPVVIRTFAGPDGAGRAIVLAENSAEIELANAAATELRNPVWKLLSPAMLSGLLRNRGEISIDQLVALDRIIGGSSVPASGIAAGRASQQVEQWLAVALEAEDTLESLGTRMPLNAAPDAARAWEHVMQMSDQTQAPIKANAPAQLLSEETLSSGAGRAQAVQQTVERLGLALEKMLAQGQTPVPDNIKQQLYRIVDTVSRELIAPPAFSAQGQVSSGDAAAAMINSLAQKIETEVAALRQTASASPSDAARVLKAMEDLSALLRSVSDMIQRQAGSGLTLPPPAASFQVLPEQIQESLAAIKANPIADPAAIVSLAGRGAEMLFQIMQTEMSALDGRSGAMGQAAGAMVSSTSVNVKNLLETVQQFLSGAVRPSGTGATGLEEILSRLMAQVQLSGPGLEAQIRGISGVLAQVESRPLQSVEVLKSSLNFSLGTVRKEMISLIQSASSESEQIVAASLTKDFEQIYMRLMQMARETGSTPFASGDPVAAGQTITEQIGSLQKSAAQLSSMISQTGAAAADLAQLSPSQLAAIQSTPAAARLPAAPSYQAAYATLASETARVTDAISSAFRPVSAALADSGARQFGEARGRLEMVLRTLADQLKSHTAQYAEKISRAAVQGESPQNIRRTIENLMRDFSADASRLFQAAARQIQTTSQDPAGLPEQIRQFLRVLNQSARELETLPQAAGRRFEEMTGQPQRQAPAQALEQLRAQAETALQKIEALQILAKPVATAEGAQQVLALPLHIDGQWKEVTIRLLRRQSGQGKKGGKSNYHIQISVSPAYAGDVAVQMDYDKGKPLHVRMAFESKSGKSWFEANRKELADSLASLGFPSVTIGLETLRVGPDPVGPVSTATGIDRKIDIKV